MRLSRIAPASVVAGLFAALAIPASSIGQGSASAPPPGGNPPFLGVPVTAFSPEGTMPVPPIVPPSLSDTASINRGQGYFSQFNCVGCHAANGAGGMGPALSNHAFIYGAEPAQIYLSILQGRPRGMPAWSRLPEAVIWDLVAYVKSISKDPADPWQHTISVSTFDTEQVPAEAEKTSDPWSYNESFSFGRAPNQHGDEAYPTNPPPKATRGQ
jgi:cytochrome c oxidase cbb3-type subunit 3